MAKLSDLVSVLAAHEVDALGTLNLFSRRLREAGRVSKAKRGRGAASMSYLDAARFLVAVGATDHPERAIEIERFFSAALPYCLPSRVEKLHPILREMHANDLSFDQATALLISRSGEIGVELVSKTYLDLERSSGGGSIYIGESCLQFAQSKLRDLSVGNVQPDNPDDMTRLHEEAMSESGRYATGKALRATFNIFLIAALRKLISSESDG